MDNTGKVKLPIVTSMYDDRGERIFDKDSDHEWWCSKCGNAATLTGSFMQCTACRVAYQGFTDPNTAIHAANVPETNTCAKCGNVLFSTDCLCHNDPGSHPSHYTSHPSGIEAEQTMTWRDHVSPQWKTNLAWVSWMLYMIPGLILGSTVHWLFLIPVVVPLAIFFIALTVYFVLFSDDSGGY